LAGHFSRFGKAYSVKGTKAHLPFTAIFAAGAADLVARCGISEDPGPIDLAIFAGGDLQPEPAAVTEQDGFPVSPGLCNLDLVRAESCEGPHRASFV
jgi:hypothetical protein